MDFGNQCSMVLGQQKGSFYYILKDLHTIAPESSKELAKQFLDFFKGHKNKVLDMYYDRAGNQYQQVKRDWATEIKDHIEKYDGTRPAGREFEAGTKGRSHRRRNILLRKSYWGNITRKCPRSGSISTSASF